jgi:hypothetical protein
MKAKNLEEKKIDKSKIALCKTSKVTKIGARSWATSVYGKKSRRLARLGCFENKQIFFWLNEIIYLMEECLSMASFSSLVQCLWVRPGAYPRVEHLTGASLL